MKYISHNECVRAARSVAGVIYSMRTEEVRSGTISKYEPVKIAGIPRGGIPAAYLVAGFLDEIPVKLVEDPADADWLIDDLVDSGTTMARYMNSHPSLRFAALFMKGDPGALPASCTIGLTLQKDEWVVFPWEVSESKDCSAEDNIVRLLQRIGEDPTREGLKETPTRVLKAYDEWFRGYKENPKDLFTVFEDGAEGVDEMVLLTNIPVMSHCEHHMTPFIGVAHVAYIPSKKIVGISKIARVVDSFSRRLQVQERLTNQIADCIQDNLQPLGVAVVITAKHFCMATRGVKMPNVDTTTSALRGVFKDKPEARAEFMSLLPR